MNVHVPVLLAETLRILAPRDGETFVDATFGRGGHSAALLAAAQTRVIAIDRDPEALAAGAPLAAASGGRLSLVPGTFDLLDAIAAAAGCAAADGVLIDAGVSSPQLDDPARGFSFQADGPLDMRMSGSGPSASDLVNGLPEAELAGLLRAYGEERRARAIARAIAAERARAPITRTLALADIVARVLGRGGPVHPATRTFQALRIAVNDELGQLARGLAAAERLLKAAGRLAVITFHSLEDRIVKLFLAERSGRRAGGSRHLPPVPQGPAASFTLVAPKPIEAGPEEVRANPRARSARLRGAVRTAAPAQPLSPDLVALASGGIAA